MHRQTEEFVAKTRELAEALDGAFCDMESELDTLRSDLSAMEEDCGEATDKAEHLEQQLIDAPLAYVLEAGTETITLRIRAHDRPGIGVGTEVRLIKGP